MRLGRCDGCGRTAMVNLSTRCRPFREDGVGEFCADCFERMSLRTDRSAAAKSAGPVGVGGRDEDDPFFENAVRVLEEDR